MITKNFVVIFFYMRNTRQLFVGNVIGQFSSQLFLFFCFFYILRFFFVLFFSYFTLPKCLFLRVVYQWLFTILAVL